ncbi:MAG: transposase [Armatimonadetes bacterium]|nr:transposase [Armatimonadota bacterium]
MRAASDRRAVPHTVRQRACPVLRRMYDLFVCVEDPDVPPDNNAAERAPNVGPALSLYS